MKLYKKITLTIAVITAMQTSVYANQDSMPAHSTPEIRFEAGFPAADKVQTIYDEIDYQRATQAYIWGIGRVAGVSLIEGLKRDLRTGIHSAAIWENSTTAKETKVLTAQTQSIYAAGSMDLHDGPIVVEIPPGVLGMVNNHRYVPLTDIGPFGPDKGKGGKFLILPPGYEGETPTGYYTVQSDTYTSIWMVRGFRAPDGNPAPAVASLKKIKSYLLSEAANPPKMSFINATITPNDLLFPTDEKFFDVLAESIRVEPVRDEDRMMLGMLAPLGIEHGKAFKPDARVKRILKKAAATGNAMARTIAYSSRNESRVVYDNRQWEKIFLAAKPSFETENYTDIDSAVTFKHQACFTADAMTLKLIGKGSQYLTAYKDEDGHWLDGNHTYKVHLPAGIPAKNFWSLTVYDSKDRSMLVNNSGKASMDSYGEMRKNQDGSVDLFIGPDAPKGYESNWLQTNKGEGFFTYFRLYGPTKAYFDRSWVPGDFVKIK